MATSLNGTTPQATYESLLKLGDNSALSASLKVISDGAGNDTPIEISTAAVQFGGSTGMYWENTNRRLGLGINAPTARLQVRGSGATSATTALRVENSAGTELFKVRDDGQLTTGKGATTNANGTFNVLHSITDSATRVFTISRDSVLRGMDIHSGGSTKISDSSGDQSFSHTANAILEVSSTTQGFLPPRMTTTQKNAIASPAAGLVVYDTDTNKLCCYNGTTWNDLF